MAYIVSLAWTPASELALPAYKLRILSRAEAFVIFILCAIC